MKYIGRKIKIIEALLKDGSLSSLTYAALECRLVIEMICYERLMVAYGYTSYSDLRRWQPKEIVQQVVNEANELAATTFKFSRSKEPIDSDNPPRSASDYEKIEYVEVGTQIGFNIKKIGQLWQALSSVALHVQVPKNKSDNLSIDGKPEKIKGKVETALKLFREINKGNLLASSPGPEISYRCDGCGEVIKRKLDLVYNGMVASCNTESCNESYLLAVTESGVEFARRVLSLPCDGCESTLEVPERLIEGLRINQSLTAECGACRHKMVIRLRPCKALIRKET